MIDWTAVIISSEIFITAIVLLVLLYLSDALK